MVGLVLGVVFGIVGAVDLLRLGRLGLGLAWVTASVLLLLTGFGGYVIILASFPLRKWVSGQRLDQSARELGLAQDFGDRPKIGESERIG
jgi:hypothetical protein